MPLVLAAACTATRITPPATPSHPTPVFVLEHAHTSSLVLSDNKGDLQRYAYGDWDYYAERQIGSGHGLAALFWPTPAGLGRRKLSGPASVAAIYRQVRVGIDAIHHIEVDAQRVAVLRDELDGLFEQATTHLDSPAVDLVFVPHPLPYSLWHNSNHVVADWLVRLGCEVSARPTLSGWVVTPRP